KISVGAIQKLLTKARELRLGWPLPDDMNDGELAKLFYPQADIRQSSRFELPDWPYVRKELSRKGVTKMLLWEEYCTQFPNRCYSYSQFCDRFLHWLKKQKRSMRQIHIAGEKLFVDYAGQTMPVVDPHSGEIRFAQIFVAVLGASNYTYAEATYSQTLQDWLGSHVRAFEFFGGVPEIVVPDNLKSAVTKACRYDPDTNPSYQQLADHYGVAVIPARPYKPKDKSKAEVGVQIIERWILAVLRHQTFFSLAELNHAIKILLEQVNNKPFKQLPGCRAEAFAELDKPALNPLPKHPYQFIDIKPAKVNIDYHVQYDKHHYSVPHHLVGEKVMLHASDSLLQILFQNNVIASHPRKHHPGTSTEPAHMPKRHSKHQQWTPERLTRWGADLGDNVKCWVENQLKSKQHPEQAYRSCLGLLNLSRSYPTERLNTACGIANKQGLDRVKQIKSILISNLDTLPLDDEPATILPQEHENVRGPKDFH
ncbi:IS21 family transposase, partial [Thalassotalea sp. ND16A]|uniref:IS21 family transposase n=1 Tax=Thalassotalea sp. ND16A TaxID=1535422 RepID=UPI000519F148